jgi:hypothetical protein
VKSSVSSILLFALCACSPEAGESLAKAPGRAATIPLNTPYQLACEGVGNDPASRTPPEFALNDFVVAINPVNKTFALPGSVDQPIHRMASDELVLRDEQIERGRDGNPEVHRISYNPDSRELIYSSSWSGIAPVFEYFKTTCSIEMS